MFKGNSHPKPCDRDQLVLKSEISSLFWQSLWKVFPLPLGDFFNWSLLVEKLAAEGYFLKRNLAGWPQNLGFASTPWLVPVRRDSMRWRHPRGGSTEDLRRPLGGGFQSARTNFDIFWQLILHDMHPQHEAFWKNRFVSISESFWCPMWHFGWVYSIFFFHHRSRWFSLLVQGYLWDYKVDPYQF